MPRPRRIRWDAPQRVTGFELVLTRDGEFLFSGLVGGLEPWHRLVFPAASPSGGSVQLRLTNQEPPPESGDHGIRRRGVALATYRQNLGLCAVVDLNLGADLAPVAAEIAWVEVEGGGLMVGGVHHLGRRKAPGASMPAFRRGESGGVEYPERRGVRPGWGGNSPPECCPRWRAISLMTSRWTRRTCTADPGRLFAGRRTALH